MPPRDSTTVSDVQRELKPKPKPHPVLQQRFNFHGSVEEFNRRLEVIDKSHRETVGYRPSGALAYDIARSPVKDDQVPVLFQVPRTKKAAVARSYAVPRTGEDVVREAVAPPPALSEDELLDGLVAAARRGSRAYHSFRAAHESAILGFANKYPVGLSPFDLRNAPDAVRTAAVGSLNKVDRAAAIAVLGTYQIVSALTVGPAAIAVAEGVAAKESIEQRSLKPLGRANVEIAKAAVTGFYEDGKAVATGDWEYIAENPGYIALDLMGLAGTAGKLARAGGGTKALRKGNLEVEALRSENAGVALAQDAIRNRRQKKADRRHDTEEILEPSKLGYFARKHLGFERKVGRELERERKLNVALRDMYRSELERVTGWSERAASARKAVGFKAHRGLTRGEQMALFIESLDVSGTWAARAAALKAAHQKWLDEGLGDPAAHEQKLRDIKLAEAALRKPSKRFTEALALTRGAVAEMEAIKVRELGLDATVASERVARAGEVVRTGEKLEDFDRPPRARDESFYVPTVPPRLTRPLAKNPFRPKRFGQYGAAVPELNRLVPELTHQFTGKAMQAGDYRIDTTRLVADAVGRTVRAATVISQYRTLLKAATPTARSEFDRPIRVTEGVPAALKDILNRTDEGELVADEVGALSKQDVAKMLEELFPGQRGPDGRWLVNKEIEGVKWVDERLIDPEAWTQPMPTSAVKIADAVNSPFRFVTLYLRPAYILNVLGATSAAFIYQGLLAPPNIARAVFAKKLYGAKVENGLRDLVGSGRAISYVQGRPVTNTTREVARFWNTITDERLRMSTAFYYGRKNGIKTREQWEALLDGAKAGDDTAFKALNEVVDRTKKAMVQLDNLTWAEQNLLRHAIFIYPWQRGAAVWSVRTLVERPVTSAALAQIGQDEAEDIADVFTDRIPGWFKNAGYIPFGFDDNGDPKVVNPASLNTFSTLNSLMHSRIDQLLGPAAELAVRTATEKDEFGNEYAPVVFSGRPGRWTAAAMDVLGALPQITAIQKSRREDGKLPTPDVTDRGSLSKRVDDALKLTVLSPGWLDGYGQLLTGGAATGRSVDRLALTARWYREASFEDRTRFQKELINRALSIQADLVGRPAGLEVRKVINLQFDRDKEVAAWQREKGRDQTPLEETLGDIAFLKARGLVGDEDVPALVKQAERLASVDEHEAFRRETFERFADPEGRLKEWDESVRRINALATPKIVNERLRRLTENGVNDAAATVALKREQLVEYGRVADAYTRELKQRLLDLAALRKTDPAEVPAAEAELVAWKSEQDKPVKIHGRVLPSPARMEWAKEWNYDDRVEAVASLAAREWKDLTRFERALLGKDTDPKIGRGWQRFAEVKAAEESKLESGETLGSKFARFNLDAAKYVDKHYAPGFYQDWLFSQQPLAYRLQRLRPVQQSAHKADWNALLTVAVQAASYLSRDGYSKAAVRDDWRKYVEGSLQPWVDSKPAFKKELDLYGDNVLVGLIN